MRHLVAATRVAVKQRNWYAALTLALTLPDICGKLETPTAKVGVRYRDWCDKYLVPKYTSQDDLYGRHHVFLNAEDAYLLRCAVLHEGSDSIASKVTSVLARFDFCEPLPSGSIHTNQVNKSLQLQVDQYSGDICLGVEQWLAEVPPTQIEVRSRMERMMRIRHW